MPLVYSAKRSDKSAKWQILALIKIAMNEIGHIDKKEYHEVVELWEASVRATHHFLKEEDIEYFKPIILNTI